MDCQKYSGYGESMKTILYYFTGTGNSLAVAKKIAASLGTCNLVSVSSMSKTEGTIVPEADRVGIICPVYFAGLPSMVAQFAGRIDLSKIPFVFSVLTYGGGGDTAAQAQLNTILKKKSGRGLSAGFSVRMPGNYILMYESPTGKKQDAILESADNELQKIIPHISLCKEHTLKRSILWSVLHSILYSRFLSGVHDRDRKFSVTDACTSCGICSSICPAGNIELVNKKPVWKHQCELCCGCIHLCPVNAIQAGKKTAGRAQYRNPDVTLSEMRNNDPSNQGINEADE